MQQRISLGPAVLTMVVFSLVSVISLWKLIEDGPRAFTVIPAVCFPVAAIVWYFIVLRIQPKATGEDSD